ncbi:MAG TPA: ABC transporter ATP-binding protein [Candidatus Pelethocola excrementipullorum]|nr:ABC transporter ATP-binding protein [Candidatus Pelethocola excrementipullorum]
MSHQVIIQNVVKQYGDFRAVNDMNFQIEKGEFFTLLGPSGCGKTTLLRMIAGFNEIDEGEILFDTQTVNYLPAHKRNIGMVFQNYAIFPHLTVKQNVAYGLKARNIRGKEQEDRIQEAMELMQIAEYQDRSPSQLSGGQQQRVALARAIVIHPSVLLMDEPLSNLDAKLRVQMRGSIRKLQKSLDITTIYVTHDQEEALAISDRIAVINAGRIEQIGRPEEIYKHPANEFVANFIGTSSFLNAYADGKGFKVGGKQYFSINLKDNYNGEVKLAVRPEYFILSEVSPDIMCGEVMMATFLGDFISYEIQIENGPIIEANQYTKDGFSMYDIGDKVGVTFALDKISVFEKNGRESLL